MPSLHHTKLNSLYLYFVKKNRSHEQCDLGDPFHQTIFKEGEYRVRTGLLESYYASKLLFF